MKIKIAIILLLFVLCFIFVKYYISNEESENISVEEELLNEKFEYSDDTLVIGIYSEDKRKLYEKFLKETLPEDISYDIVVLVPNSYRKTLYEEQEYEERSEKEINFIKVRINNSGTDILLDLPHHILDRLNKNGYLEDINNYITFPNTYLPFIKNKSINGNYVVSKWIFNNVLYYNKTVLDKYSLAFNSPVTISEIKKVSDSLYEFISVEDNKGKILSLGNTTDELGNIVETFFRLYNNEDCVSKPNIDKKTELLELLNEYFELIDRYSYEYDAFITVPSDWVFSQGKFLIKIGSNFELDVFLNEMFELNFENVKIKDSFELGVMPIVSSDNSAIINYTGSTIVNTYTSMPEKLQHVVKEFMNYLVSKEFTKDNLFKTESLFAIGSTNLPVNFDDEIDEIWSQVYMKDLLTKFLTIDNYSLFIPDGKYQMLKNAYTNYFSEVITKKKEINQVFDFIGSYKDNTDSTTSQSVIQSEMREINIGDFSDNLIFNYFSTKINYIRFPGIVNNEYSKATFEHEITQIISWIETNNIHIIHNIDKKYIPELRKRNVIKEFGKFKELENKLEISESFVNNYYQDGIIPLYLSPQVMIVNNKYVDVKSSYMNFEEFNNFVLNNNLRGKMLIIPPSDVEWGNMYYGTNLLNYLYSLDGKNQNSDSFNVIFDWYMDFLRRNTYKNDESILDEAIRFINEEFYVIEAGYGRISDLTSASRPSVPDYYKNIPFELDIIFYPYLDEYFYNQAKVSVAEYIAVVSDEESDQVIKTVYDFLSEEYFAFNYKNRKYAGIPSVIYWNNYKYLEKEINDSHIRNIIIQYLNTSCIPYRYYENQEDVLEQQLFFHSKVKSYLN